jgi:hypothetical protein
VLRHFARAAVVLTGLTLLTFGAPALASSPSDPPECKPTAQGQHGCPNPCDAYSRSNLGCFKVTFADRCDGTTVVSLGASHTAVYVIDKKTYEVKGGLTTTVTVTPHKGHVLVFARGHAPWKHKYVRPTCATPTPSATPSDSGTPAVPVDNGTPSLPVTGPAVPGLIIGALALIGLGAAGIIAARRRRTRFTA